MFLCPQNTRIYTVNYLLRVLRSKAHYKQAISKTIKHVRKHTRRCADLLLQPGRSAPLAIHKPPVAATRQRDYPDTSLPHLTACRKKSGAYDMPCKHEPVFALCISISRCPTMSACLAGQKDKFYYTNSPSCMGDSMVNRVKSYSGAPGSVNQFT